MLITKIEAIPIRIRMDEKERVNLEDDLPPQHELGEYYIDRQAFTSIYSKHHETTIIKIECDDGIIGWGEAQSPVSPRTTQVIVEDLLRPLVVGGDPFDTQLIWDRSYGAMRERGHPTGFFIDALAGVDIALWDAVGKAVGKPVHKLTGGRYRERILLYAGLGGTNAESVADMAEKHVRHGYKALKLHLLGESENVIEIATAVRERVGDGIKLMCDLHMRHSVTSAMKIGRALDRLDFTWLESPIVPEDIAGASQLTDSLDVAIAIGEWNRTRYELREAFERRAFDIVMHDIARTGITEGHRIGTVADMYNIPVAPHVGGGGIISVAATVQYSASCPNFMIMEHGHFVNGYKSAILNESFEPTNGFFEVSNKPGLGINVDEDKLKSFAFPV